MPEQHELIRRQYFCWTQDGHAPRWFDVHKITSGCWRGWIGELILMQFPDVRAYRDHLVNANDVQVRYAESLVEEQLWLPPVLVGFRDGSSIPIDGAHRLWRVLGHHLAGNWRQPKCWMVPLEQAERHGCVLDRHPHPDVPIINQIAEGYDREAHHQRAMASFAQYQQGKGEGA